MKKIIGFILAFVLSFNSVSVFASVETYYDQKPIDISEIRISYPAVELFNTLEANVTIDGNSFTAILEGQTFTYDGYNEEFMINDSYHPMNNGVYIMNRNLYIPLSLIREVVGIDYEENLKLSILSKNEVEKRQIEREKKFRALYPNLNKGLKGLDETSYKQTLDMEIGIKEFTSSDKELMEQYHSMTNTPQVEMVTVMTKDSIHNSYQYDVAISKSRYDTVDKEEVSLILLEDMAFTKEKATWSKESIENREALELKIDSRSFFIEYQNLIKKERQSDGYNYNVTLNDVDISCLSNILGNEYSDAMQLNELQNDDRVSIESIIWTVKCDFKGQVKDQHLSAIIKVIDDKPEVFMKVYFDMNGLIERLENINVVSPLEDHGIQQSIDVKKVKISIDKKSSLLLKDVKVKDGVVLVNADQFKNVIPTKVTYDESTFCFETDNSKVTFVMDDTDVMLNDTVLKSTGKSLLEDGTYYVPLKIAVELLGGVCHIDAENSVIKIYTPKYTKDNKNTTDVEELDILTKAVKQLNKSTYKSSRKVNCTIDNIVYLSEKDSYDFNYTKADLEEVEHHDPVNKYFDSKRVVKVEGNNEDSYIHEMVMENETLYYVYSENEDVPDEDKYWAKHSSVDYNLFVYDESEKLDRIQSLLKKDEKLANTYVFKGSSSDSSDEVRLRMRRLIYDGLLIDLVSQFPLDSMELNNCDIRYSYNHNGELISQEEQYILTYYDGYMKFDMTISSKITYDGFNKPIDKRIPKIDIEVE